MTLTDREKTFLPYLPVVAVLFVYAWWFTLVERPQLRVAQEAYRLAVAHQVQPSELLRRQREVDALGREVVQLEKQKTELDRNVAEITGTKAPALRHTHNKALNELLQRHHLQLVEEAPVKQGGEGHLPKSVSDALGHLVQAVPGAKGASLSSPISTEKNAQVRSLRFTGRFADVLDAVRELARSPDPPGIPIALSMAEASLQSEIRHWTLLVWM